MTPKTNKRCSNFTAILCSFWKTSHTAYVAEKILIARLLVLTLFVGTIVMRQVIYCKPFRTAKGADWKRARHSLQLQRQSFATLKLLRSQLAGPLPKSDVSEAVSILISLVVLCRCIYCFFVQLQTCWAKLLQAKHVFKQLADGVEHMHRHQIIHRDLKLENILIHSKEDTSASICINEMQNASTSMTTCAVEAMLRCLLICSLDWYGLVPPMQQHLDAAGIGWLQALRGPNGQKNKSSESRSNRMQRFVSSFFEFRWRSLTSVPAAFVAGSPLPRVLWELRHTWLLSFCSLAMTRFESARDVGSWWLIPKLFGYRKLLLRLDIHILLQASSTTNF